MDFPSLSEPAIVDLLLGGKIGVLPTDTLYGIHGRALAPRVIERIYSLRERDTNKPFIILIPAVKVLEDFEVEMADETKEFLDSIWPGKISVILPCVHPELEYLHRGQNSLAFRIPDNSSLLSLLAQTGPLVSTSVNPEGFTPAKTIAEAKNYFGDSIDFYVDEGELISNPSTVIKINNGEIDVVRQGAVEIPQK